MAWPERWPVHVVRVEQLLRAEDVAVIDLRSPAEHAQDCIPGAFNIPLFDDQERALVGTLYHRRSAEEAFGAGRRIVLERISSLVAEIATRGERDVAPGDLRARVLEIAGGGQRCMEASLHTLAEKDLPRGALVLHCWRGGLRSASVTALLHAVGLRDVYALDGGYKRYRTHVQGELEAWQAPPSFVLRGLTGVGKTLVLRELEQLRPGWTIDLEALAGHRSSILGMVGLEPVSQRAFESRLAERLRRGFPGPVVFEGESRKVGDAVIHANVWSALDSGTNLLLYADLERRIDVLLADYLARDENRAELRDRLPFIEERLGRRKWEGELVRLLEVGAERELVATLLDRYYDPLYRHSEKGRGYAAEIDASDPARAAREIAEFVEQRTASR